MWGGALQELISWGPVYFYVTSFALQIHICTIQDHLFLLLERYQFY